MPLIRLRLQRPYVPTIVWLSCLILGLINSFTTSSRAHDPTSLLPNGVIPVWNLDKAYRETTSSREKVCLNGLWMWQPTELDLLTIPNSVPPTNRWGYFKVPGSWPGITDYMQKDTQVLHRHPSWDSIDVAKIGAAWYQRKMTIPTQWNGQSISLKIETLNSYAAVFLDDQFCGEIRFPSGNLEISSHIKPGASQRLSIYVAALPLQKVMNSFTDTANARDREGSVARRGICGDVFLVAVPRGSRIDDLAIDTSYRRSELRVQTTFNDLLPHKLYRIAFQILTNDQPIHQFESDPWTVEQLTNNQLTVTNRWKPDRLWDIHTPQNLYQIKVELLDNARARLDQFWQERFGFREFWINGRDFFVNGTRLFLSAVPLDNAQVSVAASTYAATCESLRRLKSFGINLVYTHNYGCEPGAHLAFTEILRAADDVGMLVSLSQPHFSHYQWTGANADRTNGYAQHAQHCVHAADNHPSVVFYSMSHNATGYNEDMNPDMIDGINAVRDTWSARNAQFALRAESIVRELDPRRIVYHHASGNLGSMHAINFYPNFVPIQELSDWFEHWANTGVKPVFLCEYGAPFTWDWTMYRGWYQGQREFGSAAVPWEFCIAEWNAQFIGEKAYPASEAERANLIWEAKQFAAGKVWHRWDYPYEVGSTRFAERYPIFANYLQDNWRAFRTWGLSANSPWEYEHFWQLRPGVNREKKIFSTDWENLQRPGFSPDFEDQRYERFDLAYRTNDWITTPAAAALIRNNGKFLGYFAGKETRFTSKDHLFLPGEKVSKTLIAINNSRETTDVKASWSLNLQSTISGISKFRLPTGEQKRVAIEIPIPENLAPGTYTLQANFDFNSGENQTDQFTVQVLPRLTASSIRTRVALFDPQGQTRTLLDRLHFPYNVIESNDDLRSTDLLIIGKSTISTNGPVPSLDHVPTGLKVLIFEQNADVLQRRFGFRIAEYGLRNAFPRVQNHPALSGITSDHLRDWRGEATLLPGRLRYEMRPRHGATVQWCDIPVTRLWRCGNRGNVASVLIEKPGRGNFLPIIDGGYALQYSPLLEYHEGQGCVIFCQLDVTGRTETEPAADRIVEQLLHYLENFAPEPDQKVFYSGESAGRTYLQALGIEPTPWISVKGDTGVLVIGPNQGVTNKLDPNEITEWMKRGGKILATGLADQALNPPLSLKVRTSSELFVSTYFESSPASSFLAGVNPADVHNRAPAQVPLLREGASLVGNGVLGTTANSSIIFCQIKPWQFATNQQPNYRRTYRHLNFLYSRLLGNLNVNASTPLLDRIHQPCQLNEKRWLTGLYLDQPEEWDDPYRFFRW